MKDRKKTNKKGGFYIALCAAAVVVALVSYVSDLLKNDEVQPTEEQKIAFEEPDIYDEPDQETNEAKYDVVVLEPETVPDPEIVETAKKEEVDEFLPNMPAPGRVIAEFSNKTPVFYEKLGDWRNHNGIDIEAEVGEDIYVCETGVVEEIYRNNLGGCILVDHQNGYKSLYANLGQIDLVAVGDELNTGETIARAGEPSLGDLTAVPHVHFELYYGGKAIDPLTKISVG